MTNVTGYVVDVVKTSTHVSSVGYVYVSGATITIGDVSSTTSSNGYFNVSGVAATATTFIATCPRYITVEMATTSAALITMWRSKFYT